MTALEPVVLGLGLVRAGAEVEIPFAGKSVVDGEFQADAKISAILAHQLDELVALSTALAPLR